jgi:hypothetical protein
MNNLQAKRVEPSSGRRNLLGGVGAIQILGCVQINKDTV